MSTLKEIFKPEIIEFLKNNKEHITSELLQEMRSFGNEGKHLALEILDFQKDSEQYYLDSFGNRISFDGNRALKKPFAKFDLSPIHIEELTRCADDIHYFKDNYIKIVTPKGVNFPDIRDYQNEFINTILPDEHENIAGKMSRQSGKSVSTGIYLTWMYNFRSELNIGIVGNKGSQAREFLNTTKNMILSLPIWMQQGTEVWNKGSIENESKMRIMTDVPSSDAFRGFVISILVCDEAAFIRSKRWDEFIDSIMPSQSGLAWKKNIIISTMNGMNHWHQITKSAENKKNIIAEPDDVIELKNGNKCYLKDFYNKEYKTIITDKEAITNEVLIDNIIKEEDSYNVVLKIGTNGFILYDLDWKRVPRYNAKGILLEPEVFKEITVAKHGIIYFNQNYANAAIGSSHTLINADSLAEFISKEPLEIRDGKLKIYAHPEKGHQYICSVDAAKDGIDDFAVQIIDITNFKFEQVAAAQLQIDYLLMPEYINDWCQYYNNPYLIIENNEGAGASIADQMYLTYEYENLHFDKNTTSNSTNLSKGRKKYPGFRTTTKTRKLILQTLKLFIDNNNLIIHDKKTINQFYTFILLNNKYQADENCKDDAIMSLAIAFAPFCNSKNFEDMKGLVDRLYNTTDESSETSKDFIEFLTIGSFDDGIEEHINYSQDYSNNSYIVEPEGFY